MRCSIYLLIIIVSSIIILEKVSDVKMMLNDEDRGELQEETRMFLSNLNTRLVKRQTSCPPPYHVKISATQCVWSCGVGTEPDNNSNQCVCKIGYYQTGYDQFKRRICAICPKPYHVLTVDKRCVWSCGVGTEPDNNSNQCICKIGYYQTVYDTFGRRVCAICPRPYHVLTADKRCVWSCGVGTQPDNNSNQCACKSGYHQTGYDTFGRRICSL